MRWTYADSRLALILRRRLGRLGYGVPRAAVRTHLPWYVRFMGTVLLIAVSAAGAAWIYDAGSRFAGFDRSESDQEIAALRSRVAQLESELAGLRTVARAADSTFKMERSVQQELAAQVKALEADNARLKEDLAFFENMAAGERSTVGVGIGRIQVESAGLPGEYRYRMLFFQPGGKRDREFEGRVELAVTVDRAGVISTLAFPDAGEGNSKAFDVRFRHFRRFDGVFRVPDGARPVRVDVRLKQDGAIKASQSLVL